MNADVLAASIDAFGTADLLQIRALPPLDPGPGEIVVEVDAASVNPIDIRRRNGYGRRLLSVMGAATMPLVLGNDFAGTVRAVGRGVRQFREGDAVFGAKPPSRAGTHATRVAVRAEHAVHRPATVSAEHLAALPYNYLTVRRALAGAGITPEGIRGRRVLVHGASGGLGLIAVWLLARYGARVTAMSGARGVQACRDAGAETVVDRSHLKLQHLPRDFAATLNFASWEDEPALLRRLSDDAIGHATTVHPLLGNFDHRGWLGGAVSTLKGKRSMRSLVTPGARYAWAVFGPDRHALGDLARHAGRLVLPEISTYSLARAADAHRHVEQRLPGRAILLPRAA